MVWAWGKRAVARGRRRHVKKQLRSKDMALRLRGSKCGDSIKGLGAGFPMIIYNNRTLVAHLCFCVRKAVTSTHPHYKICIFGVAQFRLGRWRRGRMRGSSSGLGGERAARGVTMRRAICAQCRAPIHLGKTFCLWYRRNQVSGKISRPKTSRLAGKRSMVQ